MTEAAKTEMTPKPRKTRAKAKVVEDAAPIDVAPTAEVATLPELALLAISPAM